MLKYHLSISLEIQKYRRINSGDCTSMGMKMASSVEECAAAAIGLGLKETSVYNNGPYQAKDRPYGCIYWVKNWLAWVPSEGNVYDNVPCGSADPSVTAYSSTYDCLCVQGKILDECGNIT